MSLNGIQEVKAHQSQGWSKALFTEVALCLRVCICVC